MENKDFPEMENPELTPEEIPSLFQNDGDMLPEEDITPAEAPEIPAVPAEEAPAPVDFFADILPHQPVSDAVTEDTAAGEPESPAAEPMPDSTGLPSTDTQMLRDIQSAVQHILEEDFQESTEAEEASPESDPENTADDPSLCALTGGEQPVEAPPADTLTGTEEFAGLSEAAPEQESVSPVPRPVRKGRPKRKKGEFLFGLPQIAVTCVWLALILLTGVTLGRMLWVCAADVLAFGREDRMVTITIYESDTIEDVTEKLHRAGLIHYPGLFNLYAGLAVDEGEIQPGIWDLNTMYDYHALVSMMSPSSSREVVENVLIPEGYSCRQIFELLEANRVCTAKDLAEYAASGELKEYWFLEGHERGYEYCLEGFLFPDTYDFYKNSSPRDVLEKMLDNFDYRFTEEMRAQIDTLNADVTNGTFDVHKVVIVASLIEKETASNDESPLIASVIYNRLFRWGNTPAYLNIDATIVYALDGKTDLTAEDLKVESPYNTYTNIGLTPGAIANPGLASLKAALNPAQTNYYFYVLNPAMGEHKFSTTLEEHNAFIASLE